MKESTKLTAKQNSFVQEYLVDLNGAQAAIRAGYSVNSAKQIATENLSKLYLQDAIQQAMEERQKRTQITQDWVLNGIKDLTDELVKSESPAAAYKGFELAGKHLKLFTDKLEQDTTLTVVRKQYKSNNDE